MEAIPWVVESNDRALKLSVNLDVYPLSVLFRACYLFTDKCYVFLEREKGSHEVIVHFAAKASYDGLAALAGDFCNELVNQKVRSDISAETNPLRELIVAQAFTEAGLLDRSASDSDYHEDPRGIAR
ncbi:MAG TPA: His-Xaa-Ser system protein HxsD [Terriglobia bacterium]|nr:His-Xaa-Ser system protein HxsD [Terriglobia bacterium]